MKFPKEIHGLEEKINRFARLKSELGNDVTKQVEEIEDYLTMQIAHLDSLSSGYRNKEVSDIEKIIATSKFPNIKYPVTDYSNRLKGAIYARFIGCALGAPVELLSIGELKSFAKQTNMTYPPDYYWKKAPNGYFPRYKVGKGNDFTSTEMTFLSADDDIAYTFLSMLIMEKHGKNFTTEDVAKMWLKYLPIECTFTAERETLKNLYKGIDPKIAGEVNNPDTEFIGASIRCDGYGYVHPGNPMQASILSHKDAILSHRRSGVYSAMYFAAVISLAFSAVKIEDALEKGLDFIPSNSEFSKQIEWALKNYENISNFEDANRLITSRFPGMSWVHSINNACLTIWGILLGKEDIIKGITETVAMGYDNDCTAATVGSVLGAYHGFDKIDKKWYSPWNNRALSYLNGIDEFDINDVVNRYEKLYLNDNNL